MNRKTFLIRTLTNAAPVNADNLSSLIISQEQREDAKSLIALIETYNCDEEGDMETVVPGDGDVVTENRDEDGAMEMNETEGGDDLPVSSSGGVVSAESLENAATMEAAVNAFRALPDDQRNGNRQSSPEEVKTLLDQVTLDWSVCASRAKTSPGPPSQDTI